FSDIINRNAARENHRQNFLRFCCQSPIEALPRAAVFTLHFCIQENRRHWIAFYSRNLEIFSNSEGFYQLHPSKLAAKLRLLVTVKLYRINPSVGNNLFYLFRRFINKNADATYKRRQAQNYISRFIN